ncbi:hypothetical protein [Actinoplanes solisilvae]|uniref:hypothetical protein n=1 Tax=Actinoplanes solisilvae TaxID=2486853 RepID=UPI000FD7F6DD|nr:hypothetical protein [Actinoplanes solisilvae]
MTETARASSAGNDSSLWRIIQGVELVDVRVTRWYSELRDFEVREIQEFDPVFSVDFRNDDETLQFKWDFDASINSKTGHPVADLGLGIVQTFTVTDRDLRPLMTERLIHEFVEKTAVISIVPFVREAVQTMTVRLGLPPLTLGLVRAGKAVPQAYSVRP